MQEFIDPQAYLAAIVTSSEDAIISKDLNGNITTWNPAAERIFGYTAEEAIGKHITLIIPPDRLAEEDYIIGKIKRGERITHFEAIRRTKSGKLVTLSVRISPIKNSQGEIIGASKVARDITDIKEAERISAYYGAIIESSDDAIISKNLDGIITSWNPGAERIFGYKAEEIIGKHITMIIPHERLAEESKILTTLRSGDRIDHFDTWRRHKDGHLIPISLTVSPIRNSKGEIVGASKISRDITDRLRAADALKQMNIKKDEFLANMSHELRTPMNAVIGLANLLQHSKTLSETDRKFVDTLKISADNLMDLINDLLDFAKLESDSLQLERIEFNLGEQIEKVVKVLSIKAQEKKLRLGIDYDPSLQQYFLGDPLRVHQIVMNLVSNAVKFTEHGNVEIKVTGAADPQSDKTSITIRVSDTGIGIAQDKLESIFEKFTQSDASISRKYGGSGLGLAITKALVEKMHGTIRVESELGIGATFIVTIPFENAHEIHAIRDFKIETLCEPAIEKNVLLVEDYEPNVLVATSMLEGMGYNFDVAYNGVEALKKFVQNKYDVVLMDVQMHELDGLETTRRIRQIEQEKSMGHTPIIAMTAHVREQDKNQCMESGMDDFIPKPFEPSDLFQKLQDYITKNTAKRSA